LLLKAGVRSPNTAATFSAKAIFDVLCQQGDLIYGRPPVSRTSLLLSKQCFGDWFDTSVDEPLKDLEGDAQKIYIRQ